MVKRMANAITTGRGRFLVAFVIRQDRQTLPNVFVTAKEDRDD